MSARLPAECAWWIDSTYYSNGQPRAHTPKCECSWSGPEFLAVKGAREDAIRLALAHVRRRRPGAPSEAATPVALWTA